MNDIHERSTNLIVVGIDESEGARAAAEWAAKEALQRHASLHLVTAYPTRISAGVADVIPGIANQEALNELQRQLRAELIAAHPGLRVTGIVAYEEPIPLLLRESEHALMLVVATRGAGRFSHVAMGSVAFGVTSRAKVPVIVVRPGTDFTEPRGPVVVGVDGSPVSEQALAFAFEAAAVRGTSLLAVHAWDTDRAFDPEASPADVERVTLDDLEQVERVVVAERLAGWSERYPDVPIDTVLLTERPGDGLERLSKKAQLVVVGSRGRNRFAGAVLGSTCQHLIVHAGSPVAVVRPDDR
jgi:nucleotide-binding universal stress UspA family protein